MARTAVSPSATHQRWTIEHKGAKLENSQAAVSLMRAMRTGMHSTIRDLERGSGRSAILREMGLVRLDTGLELLLHALAGGRQGCVLATVIATAGSTYRKGGARMLMMGGGDQIGLLSGGCLEADLQIHAEEVLRRGEARVVDYDMRGPDDEIFGIGAGCEGAMRILLEPAGPATQTRAALLAAHQATYRGQPALLVVVHDGPGLLGTQPVTSGLPAALVAAAHTALSLRESQHIAWAEAGVPARAYVQYLAPPPHLLLCGAGPDCAPIVKTAAMLGWRLSLTDHRDSHATSGRFTQAQVSLGSASTLRDRIDLQHVHAAVVMSHHLQTDVAYLRELAAAAQPGYVGLLGPPARRAKILSLLGASADTLHGRLHGPVGIDIGAATPEAIALSIVAQIHAWLAGHDM